MTNDSVSRRARQALADPSGPVAGPGRAGAALDWDPGLVEEAVLLGVRGHREERTFRRERDRRYEIPDPEARETAFRTLHAVWFVRLGLARIVVQALGEQPSIAEATQGCRVGPARSRNEEGAELFVRPCSGDGSEGAARWVVIRLRPETMTSPDRALTFLRHEFFHIADMLNPRFEYEPSLPPAPAGPAHEALQRDRYRVLWDTTIDGCLLRLGRASASVRAARYAEFVRTFPMLGARAGEAFARFFDGPPCTHVDLVSFATQPDAVAFHSAPGPRPQTAGPSPGERCPVCGFPTHVFEPDPSNLSGETRAHIQADFPSWDPAQGLCRQCADLYRSRHGAPAQERRA